MKNLALSLLCLIPLAGCSSLGADKGPQPASLPAAGAMTARDETALYLNVIDGLIKQERYAAALAFLDGYAGREKTPQTRYWLMRGNALLGLHRPAEALPSFAKLEG